MIIILDFSKALNRSYNNYNNDPISLLYAVNTYRVKINGIRTTLLKVKQCWKRRNNFIERCYHFVICIFVYKILVCTLNITPLYISRDQMLWLCIALEDKKQTISVLKRCVLCIHYTVCVWLYCIVI